MHTEKYIKFTSRLIIILAILFVGTAYLAFWIQGVLELFLLLFDILLAFILLILTGRRLITIILTKNYKLFTAFIIGLLALILVIFRPVEKIIEEFKSPVLLAGYCEHTIAHVSILLRKDRSMEYYVGGFMQSNKYYGSYEMKGDTFIIKFLEPPHIKYNDTLILSGNILEEIGDTTQHTHHFLLKTNKLKN